jgi:hypothetical protein
MANKKIVIKIPRQHGDTFLRMEVHPNMKIPGLLKKIEATDMVKYHPQTNHVKPGELKNDARYEVFTEDVYKTLELIKNYKNGNNGNLREIREWNPLGQGEIFPPQEVPKEIPKKELKYKKSEQTNYLSRLVSKLF